MAPRPYLSLYEFVFGCHFGSSGHRLPDSLLLMAWHDLGACPWDSCHIAPLGGGELAIWQPAQYTPSWWLRWLTQWSCAILALVGLLLISLVRLWAVRAPERVLNVVRLPCGGRVSTFIDGA